tara:strand:- start:1023 stop:1232 length:210 start_codon:yes stop_codon:yes gene_type:complete
MEEILDLIATDAKAAQVTDKIKDVLYTKSAEKIDTFKPNIANSMFSTPEPGDSGEEEVSQEEPGEEEES